MKQLLLALLLSASTVFAAPVNIVISVTPGGAIDLTGRTLSKILSDNNIDNIVTYKPGADGDIAYNYTMAEHDNVILVGAAANFVFSHVVQKRDNFHSTTMTIIAPVAKTSMAFITGPKGFATFKDMIASAKTTPLPCGVSNAHGTVELTRINKLYETKFEPVPYKGSGPVAQDLGGDNLRCAYDSVATHIPRHEAGQLKILAVTHSIKIQVPLASTVLPGYTFENWYGFAIPNGSNLLADHRLMDIIQNFSKHTNETKPMVDQGFIMEKPLKNINEINYLQTREYRKLVQ
jgi:tripartite-type tricarboxylate transporter receptor subunit TctC